MSKISNTPIGKTDGAPRALVQSGTRQEILKSLKLQGERSAATLGEEMSVTPMAVRLHLYELEAEGLVAARSTPEGRGRPVKYWSLTPEAARIFPDAHQGLAVEMIKSVEELFGAAGLNKVIKKHGDIQRKAYREKLASAKTMAERVKRLARARNDEGYMAEARRDGRDWLLIENHCPICSAARACTGLCKNELTVFSDVLGKDVHIAREEHILSGARRCVYRVKARG